MAAQFQKDFYQDLNQDVKIRQCGTIVFTGDNESNIITVSLFNGQTPAPQTGSVACYVIRSDGKTVPTIAGTIDGNTVSVTLTKECFTRPGPIGVGVQVIDGTIKTTVLKAVYNVETLYTDEVIDPSGEITLNVGDLVQRIDDAVASIPADYSALLAAIAPNYTDLTFPVAAGTWCWHDGDLYRAKVDIPSTESWTAAHWETAPLSNALAGDVADLKSAISADHTVRIPLFPCQFIGDAYMNASGNLSDNDHCICSIRALMFKALGNVHVYSNDANLSFTVRFAGSSELSAKMKTFTFSGDVGIVLNIIRDDLATVKASDLDSIIIETNKATHDQYIKDNTYQLSETNRFENQGVDHIYRYGMYTDNDRLGFAQRNQTYYRITNQPCVSQADVILICGRSSTNTMEILVDNELTTIKEGEWLTVPANTYFQVAFKSQSQSGTNSISTACIYVVDGSDPKTAIVQYLCTANITRADCAFMVDDKIFSISRDNEQIYSVWYKGEYIVQNAPLDHTAGHANSCNYANGKAYVSDWTDGTLIHVFAVDAVGNTLTYERDIVLPATEFGALEYYVKNNENEIFFVGWQSGNSSTDPNNLVYGLFIKTSAGYEMAWYRKAIRPIIMQSFTLQNDCIYYLENSADYKTTAVFNLSMITGLTENTSSIVGTLAENEGEAIIPIGNKSFYVLDKNGRLFFTSVT